MFERYLLCHATCESYLQYAAFEAKRASVEAARAIYERCAVELGEAEVHCGGRHPKNNACQAGISFRWFEISLD